MKANLRAEKRRFHALKRVWSEKFYETTPPDPIPLIPPVTKAPSKFFQLETPPDYTSFFTVRKSVRQCLVGYLILTDSIHFSFKQLHLDVVGGHCGAGSRCEATNAAVIILKKKSTHRYSLFKVIAT